jgi:hypothetical protein
MRDGRLRGNDAESLRRHLQTCAVCAAEQASVTRVRADLQDLPPPQLDAVAARRIRQRLLGEHNRWLLRQGGAPMPRRRRLVLVAACAAFVSAIALFFLLRPRASVGADGDGPHIDVEARTNTTWRREAAPHAARIVLEDGTLRLAIRRPHAEDRVTIALPDGYIEDVGTVLDVTATGGHTTEVRVEQGRVILHLQADEPRTLAAGQSWRRTPPLAEREPATAPLPAPAPSAEDASNARKAPHPTRGAPGGPQRVHLAAEKSAQNQPESRPSPAEALAGKAEDDAYLRVVNLLDAGRVDLARDAAKDYLLRFPNGFRRLEVLNIATRPAH